VRAEAILRSTKYIFITPLFLASISPLGVVSDYATKGSKSPDLQIRNVPICYCLYLLGWYDR